MALAIEIVALSVATYGAGLSTYNVALARRQARPDVLISSRLALVDEGPWSPYAKRVVRVTVANVGHRSVEVENIYVRDDTGEHWVIGQYPESSDELPQLIATGESVRIDMPFEQFLDVAATQADAMRFFTVALDTAENEFTSRLAPQIEAKVFELAHLDDIDDAVVQVDGR